MYSNLFRIGRDVELRYTASGKAVCGLSLACDIGYGDNKRTSWIEGALWEKRAESLTQYLTKGKQVFVVLDDIEIEVFDKKDGGQGSKLKGRIVDIKLIGGSAHQPTPDKQQFKPSAKQSQSVEDDYFNTAPDDDLLF